MSQDLVNLKCECEIRIQTMKCLVVSAYYPLSRSDFAGSFVRDEACELVKNGVTVHVGRWSHISQGIPAKTRVIDRVFVHDVRFKLADFLFSLPDFFELPRPRLSRLKETGIMLSYSRGVEKLVRRHDVDLIHAHFAYPEGLVGLIAKKRTGRPLLVTLHGYDILVEPTVNYGCRLDPEIDRVVGKVLREADGVIAASSATYNAALELGCSPAKLSLIPNAVDFRRFDLKVDKLRARKKLGLESDPIVFTLRAHEPQKGVEYLIRAIPLVLAEVPDAVFVIGGDGSLRRYHQSLADELGVSANVIFTGKIPDVELPYFYLACDVFVIPSLVEAFGLVTIEAMACGKPVIGTNVGGIPDTIIEGLTGFLVSPRDPSGLSEKIVLLLKSCQLRGEMGRAGKETVNRRFNMEERIKRIVRLYESLKRDE